MSENKTQAELEIELDLYIDRDKSKGVNPEKVTKRDSSLEVTTAEEI
tara:strand:- start:27 stop:167 length:141 start_codon:yes stop_codon:yes gene_type:complete